MKKIFFTAALVLACTVGSNASDLNEAVLNASMAESNSELMPVKKTTKKTSSKKTTTKKKTTSTKKTTATKSTSTAAKATTTTAAATTPAATPTTSNVAAATSSNTTGSTVADVLGGLIGAATGNSSSNAAGDILNGILNNVIGSGTFKKEDLCHTWKYSKPGCAFTSENLLAKAGGEIAANKVEEKLSTYYKKFGFNATNTYFTFKTDGTFSAKIDGKAWNGTYTFDEKTHAIHLKGVLLSASGYATKTTNGISLLFDQKKLLNLIKALSAFKGSSTLSAVGNVANNYDGMRIGFEMTK